MLAFGINKYLSIAQSCLTCICLVRTHLIAEESETSCEDSNVRRFDEEEDGSWTSWFCNKKGNEFFCEVDDDYILDDFNRSGLRNQVPFYDYALDLILDVESSDIGKTYLPFPLTSSLNDFN